MPNSTDRSMEIRTAKCPLNLVMWTCLWLVKSNFIKVVGEKLEQSRLKSKEIRRTARADTLALF